MLVVVNDQQHQDDPSWPFWVADGIRRRPLDRDDLGDLQFVASKGAIPPLYDGGKPWVAANLDAFGVPEGTLSEAQITVLADKVAASVAAAVVNEVGELDADVVVGAVKRALREGSAE